MSPAPITPLEVAGRATVDENTWVLHFPYRSNPIPMNGPKANWRARARWTRTVKDTTLRLAIAARIPEMTRCRAHLTWWVATAHRRDVDNLAAFEKPMYDALVLAGIVRDDTPDLMDKPRPTIRHVSEAAGLISRPGFTLHITRLTDTDELEL